MELQILLLSSKLNFKKLLLLLPPLNGSQENQITQMINRNIHLSLQSVQEESLA